MKSVARWTPAAHFAAYITGNVASNLIGRLVSAGVADHLGLAANFYFFSALNLAGAVLVYFTIRTTMPVMPMARRLRRAGRNICGIRHCVRHSASAFVSCSRSSARSPT